MAEIVTERIQPCLFDRLTDEDPGSVQESRASRVMSLQRYRDGVLRDLRWLLNSSAHLNDEEWDQYGEVRKSVLNFGTEDFCGKLAGNLDLHAVEHEIVEAIKAFEPRILPNTLIVKAVGDSDAHSPSVIAFEIRADLWAAPMPEQLYIKTQIDLETGQCVV